MPRKKYVAKCSYCRGSKLSDAQFEALLWYYIQGASAEKARELVMDHVPEAPSDKTINRYFKRFGEAIWDRFVAPILLTVPEFAELKKKDPSGWRAVVEEAVSASHQRYMSSELTPLTRRREFSAQVARVTATYRKISATRFGVSQNKVATLALAFFKEDHEAFIRERIGRAITERELLLSMWLMLRGGFKKDPL